MREGRNSDPAGILPGSRTRLGGLDPFDPQKG